MPTGQVIILSVTDLDPSYYGRDPHPPSNNVRLGPDRDAKMIRDMFVEQCSRVPGLQIPIHLGSVPQSAGGPPTRSGLTAALTTAASQLTGPHDTLFFYYSGHGAQLKPGIAGTDSRNVLCLADGFFLDVELVALWHRFSPNCRVIMFSDCCHAGDIATTSLWQKLTSVVRRLVGKDTRGPVRSMFDDRADEVARANSIVLAQQFAAAASAGGADVAGIPCPLLNFAACGPAEVLPAPDGESPFALRLVTDFGLHRTTLNSYVELATRICRDMGKGISPQLDAAGPPDASFSDSTPPFTL